MINQVNKGDSLAIRAQDWNLIADTANAFAQGEILSSRQRDHKNAGSQQTLYFSCENEVKFGRAVRLDGTDADFSEADIQYDSPILKGDLTFNDVGQPFAIATTGAAAGDLVEIALHGQVLIYVNLKDTAHNYAQPKAGTTTGELESCPSGPIKLLTKDDTNTGNQWCLALLNQAESYSGYFKVIVNGNYAEVVDGQDYPSQQCGIAYFNVTKYLINKTTNLSLNATQTNYIWLEYVAGDQAPTIQSGTSLPDQDYGYAVVLLARIKRGVVRQEHHGIVYAQIYAEECEGQS